MVWNNGSRLGWLVLVLGVYIFCFLFCIFIAVAAVAGVDCYRAKN